MFHVVYLGHIYVLKLALSYVKFSATLSDIAY